MNQFKDFVGKTISHVDDSIVNLVTFYFTDNTMIDVYAECGTDKFSIPFFEVGDVEKDEE